MRIAVNGAAVEAGARSVAFPAVSCGVYGYPIPDAAAIATATVAAFLREHTGINLVRFVLFGDETFEVFSEALERTSGGPP